MNSINKLILTTCTILTVSCNSFVRVNGDIAKLKSEAIVIPYDKLVCFEGSKTKPDETVGSILVYIDSSDCSVCSLNNLPYWDHLNKIIHDETGFQLQIIPVFKPAKDYKDALLWHVKRQQNSFDIYVDTLGAFYASNSHLPDNKELHTFLLDKDNNVILVGNPIHNKELQSLYIATAAKYIRLFSGQSMSDRD